MEERCHLVNAVHHPLDVLLPALPGLGPRAAGQHPGLCDGDSANISLVTLFPSHVGCISYHFVGITSIVLRSQISSVRRRADTGVPLRVLVRLAAHPHHRHVEQLRLQFALLIVQEPAVLLAPTHAV